MNEQHRIFTRCARRLIPFMVLLYVVNFVDRVNVGFAALTMNKDLGFSPAVYGFGAGIFFFGYFLFHVPANAILLRVGARRWVFCILVVWGALSASCAFVQGPLSFYSLRFLLGVAEAGFYPGMLFYLTYWFPQAYRARFTASFIIGIPLAFIVGGPLSGIILGMDGVLGLHGWQWLFLLEGAPAMVLAFAVLRLLPDGPRDASWLTSAEKEIILAQLASEGTARQQEFWPALRDPRVLLLCLVWFGTSCGAYGIQLWLPQIVQAMGISNRLTGFLVALPYAVSILSMVLWGWSSDAKGERVWHVVLPALATAGGFAVASVAGLDLVVFLALSVAAISVLTLQPPFWSLTSSFLRGPAAAGGIALVSGFGSFGGFLGPTLIGVLRQQTGSYAASMGALALALTLAACVVLVLGRVIAPRPGMVGSRPPMPSKP